MSTHTLTTPTKPRMKRLLAALLALCLLLSAVPLTGLPAVELLPTAKAAGNEYVIRYFADENTAPSPLTTMATSGVSTRLLTHFELGFWKQGYAPVGWKIQRTSDGKFLALNEAGEKYWVNRNGTGLRSGYTYYVHDLYDDDGALASDLALTVNEGELRLYLQYEVFSDENTAFSLEQQERESPDDEILVTTTVRGAEGLKSGVFVIMYNDEDVTIDNAYFNGNLVELSNASSEFWSVKDQLIEGISDLSGGYYNNFFPIRYTFTEPLTGDFNICSLIVAKEDLSAEAASIGIVSSASDWEAGYAKDFSVDSRNFLSVQLKTWSGQPTVTLKTDTSETGCVYFSVVLQNCADLYALSFDIYYDPMQFTAEDFITNETYFKNANGAADMNLTENGVIHCSCFVKDTFGTDSLEAFAVTLGVRSGVRGDTAITVADHYAGDQLRPASTVFSVPQFVLGDVDNDAKITVTDGQLTLSAAIGAREATRPMDVTRNNIVTSLDARLILRAAAGLDSSVPEEYESPGYGADGDPMITVTADTSEAGYVNLTLHVKNAEGLTNADCVILYDSSVLAFANLDSAPDGAAYTKLMFGYDQTKVNDVSAIRFAFCFYDENSINKADFSLIKIRMRIVNTNASATYVDCMVPDSGGVRMYASENLLTIKTTASYTVAYNANGGTGAPASQTKTEGKALTLSGTKPTKTYKLTFDANGGSVKTTSAAVAAVFKNWNTKADGSGTTYAPGGSYTANASVSLYAQWTEPKAGSLPTPTRSGYTFLGWYTTADGGTQVASSTTVTKTQTLYAHWKAIPTYTVSYNANGGTGAPGAQTKTGGKALALSGTKPTKTYKLTFDANGGSVKTASAALSAVFKNWNTKADGSGKAYAPGAAYTSDASVTLYAQWTNPKAGTLPTPTRSGFTFAGWYTFPSGGSKVTADTTVTKSQTLYAQWTPIGYYNVSYNANGGAGAPAAQKKTQGKALTLSGTKPAKTLKLTFDANGGSVKTASATLSAVFKSWNTKADGSGKSYAPGASYTTDAALTLYAQWTNPKAGSLPTPTRSGYTFAGWYTAPADGTKITAETTVTISRTLYAHWTKPPTYTVKYNANGGTGAPGQQTKNKGAALTLSGTKPVKTYQLTLNANGGSVSPASTTVSAAFKNWNTIEDGSGAAYAPGAKYTADADVTLYAQYTDPKAGDLAVPTRTGYTFAGWFTAQSGGTQVTASTVVTKSQTLYAHWKTIPTYTVIYNANGGTGAPASQIKTGGKTLTLSGTKPVKTYKLTYNVNGGSALSPASKTVSAVFKNWNTIENGSGAAYAPGASYTVDAAATLYAQWTNPKAGTLPTPTRSGYTFAGWFTSATNGTQVTSSTTITKSQTIYAQWKPVPPTRAVTYNANGGTGAPATQTKIQGKTLTLSGTKPTKTVKLTYNAGGGKVTPTSKSLTATFKSWNTKADGSGKTYAPGAAYTADVSITLYAQWTNPKAGDLAVPTRAGYTFTGWYTEAKGGGRIADATVITKSQTLYAHWEKIDPFTWGRDNWRFINDDSTGDFPATPYRKQISGDYAAVLKKNLTNSEYQTVFGVSGKNNGKLDRDWTGSCYGMSALVILARQGMIPVNAYKAGAKSIHDLPQPKKDAGVSSLITYYHMLQYRDVIQQQYRATSSRPKEDNIKRIISLIDQNGMALISYAQADFGHAVVAYDYDYYSYTYAGVTYQGCIKVWDPDASTAYNKNCNIYFNTQSYNWAIPEHSVSSVRGAKMYYIGSDPADLNSGGYHAGSDSAAYKDFVARLNVPQLSNDASGVSKVKKGTDGDYMDISAKAGEIVEDNAYDFGASNSATFGYNLKDAAASYRVFQENALPLSASMDYEACDLTANAAAGQEALFDPRGCVSIKNESAAYTLGMTFDKDYPTSWFHVEASGSSVNDASLEKTKDGYVLSADTLQGVTVTVSNRETVVTVTFSAACPKVLIYEIDPTTVGIKGDTDANGTFDKVIAKAKADAPAPVDVRPGDVNGDGQITAEDARFTLRAAVGLDDTAEGLDFSNKQNRCYIAANVDGEDGISAADARLILRAAVGLEHLS